MNILKYKFLDGKWVNWPIATLLSCIIGAYGFYVESVVVIFSPLIFIFGVGVLQDRYEAEASNVKVEEQDSIMTDECLGLNVLHSDGTGDFLYQRLDGSYYWKNEYVGVTFSDVSSKTHHLNHDSNYFPVSAEDSTTAKPFLDDGT